MELLTEVEKIQQELSAMAKFPEMNPGPVCRFNHDGKVLLANTKAKKVFGEDKLIGQSWFDICPGMNPELWDAILNCKSTYPVETDLGDVYMLFTYVCKPGEEFVFVYGTDITINKQNERKLEEQRATIAEIARFPDMNPGPVLRMGLDSLILLSNAAASSVFGENLAGMRWLDICPGITRDVWENILSTEAVVPFEAHVGDKDFVFNHRMDSKTKFVFVYGTDITINKLNERKLEEQKATIAEIARFPDMNPGPVLRMNLDSLVLLSNAAASSVFGENLAGMKWVEICPNITPEVWDEIVNATHVVPVEAHLGKKHFVFNHRRDFKTNLVFVFGADITLQKMAETQLRQSEKMATLGTLAAGVAHELNNPAAAAKRAAQQLKEAFTQLEKIYTRLNGMELGEAERNLMSSFLEKAKEIAGKTSELSSLSRSDKEAEMEEWLEERNVENAWQFAPSLVGMGVDVAYLNEVAGKINEDTLPDIIAWASTIFPVYSLLHEIGEGSGRISEIVVALKNYSFLGQAPIQQVNIHEGIDNTLVILRSKLKSGIDIQREYSADVPSIMAYGSELNQVWTNILDNAIDAMKGKGTIIIRTRKEKNNVVVEMEDSGPGIPPSNLEKIFDPFFTTKEPGKGTGLGLSTSYGIITEKHHGTIKVESRQGSTKFIICLPIKPQS